MPKLDSSGRNFNGGGNYPENLEEMLKDEIAAHASATFDPDAFRGAFILAYKPEDSQEYQNAVKEWGGELSKVMEVIEKL
jgi:selenophosphate synthase